MNNTRIISLVLVIIFFSLSFFTVMPQQVSAQCYGAGCGYDVGGICGACGCCGGGGGSGGEGYYQGYYQGSYYGQSYYQGYYQGYYQDYYQDYYESVYCYPSCPTACGQANGCGGACSTAQLGVPSVPTITSPSTEGEQLITDASGNVTVTWSTNALADSYEYEIYPSGTSCNDPDAHCSSTTGGTYTFPAIHAAYSMRVRAVNVTCNAQAGGDQISAWSSLRNFTTVTPITGTVYFDEDSLAGFSGSLCNNPGGLSTIQAGSSTVTGTGSSYNETKNVAVNGTYQVNLPYWNPGNNTLTLNIGQSDTYTCSCPAGCTYSGLNSPLSGVNFFITEARDPWFQVVGGPVVAYEESGQAIYNPVSNVCVTDPSCEPYMIVQNDGTANTSGYVLSGGGTVDLSAAAGTQSDLVDQDQRNIVGRVTSRVADQRYEYFARLYRLPSVPESDFGASSVDAQKPTGTPINNNVNAYFHDGDMTLQDAWTVDADENITVFVNGDLSLRNTVTVTEGGFLAFIVSGDITIDASVGHTDETETTPVIEGVYIANGQILLPSIGAASGGDKRFVGAGSFVGWNGIVLDRDYDDAGVRKKLNNTSPVEVFRYRPDFVLSAPAEMRLPNYQWREVNP